MRKLLFFYLLIPYFIFGSINDELNIFSGDERKNLEKRIIQLQELYGVNFEIYTSNDDDFNLENKLKNKLKTVIIDFQSKKDKVTNVKISLSEDLDFSSYAEEIDSTLKELSVFIEKEEYGDYTYELLADVGDIINIIQLEDKKEQSKRLRENSNLFLIAFKVIIVLILLLLGYLLLLYFVRAKHKTYCNICNKNMIIDQEIERENSIMKIYKCPTCGKRKRVNIKRY